MDERELERKIEEVVKEKLENLSRDWRFKEALESAIKEVLDEREFNERVSKALDDYRVKDELKRIIKEVM